MESCFNTAAIYARVSTKRQAREGFSLEVKSRLVKKEP